MATKKGWQTLTMKVEISPLKKLQEEINQREVMPCFGIIAKNKSLSNVATEDESKEETEAFVKAMLACISDFVEKTMDFSEESYDVHRPNTPDPEDYGSEAYIYESRIEVKQKCREQVTEILGDLTDNMKRVIRDVQANTLSGLDDLNEIISEFAPWFSEQYDRNLNLECSTDEAIEIVTGKKSVLCAFAQELSETSVKSVIDQLSKEQLEVPQFDEQTYFQMCKIDREDDALCFLLDDLCDRLEHEVETFMDDVIEPFQDSVRDAVQNKTAEVCRSIVQQLNALLE